MSAAPPAPLPVRSSPATRSRGSSRWVRRGLLLLALAVIALMVLAFVLDRMDFNLPVQVQIDGEELFSSSHHGAQTTIEKLLMLVALLVATLLAVLLIVPAVLLLQLFALALLVVVVVGLPMFALLMVAMLLLSPLLLIGWLLWRALAA